MKVVQKFGARKDNGRVVIVNPEEVVDLHQDAGPGATFHVVKGKQRGATFTLTADDRRIAKLEDIETRM